MVLSESCTDPQNFLGRSPEGRPHHSRLEAVTKALWDERAWKFVALILDIFLNLMSLSGAR